MALYQDPGGLDGENFVANFSFPQNGDIEQPLPIVDNILPQVPSTDHRAANDFLNTIAGLIADLPKFQDTLAMMHSLLSVDRSSRAKCRFSERFPSPEIIRTKLAELQEQLAKMTEAAVSSGVAALSADAENVGNTLWMNLGGLGHGGEDQINVNRTFQKMEGMKKSANAVVSVLKRPATRDT